ncbi:hypothetical protein BVRB_3g062410 [Beta vulgaris subsp. vulgaris]|uniref:uncharacterized protein LOC104889442 n=1 Tax=Beta vulgaris subsp. vulgaris TaxID=3555 RepID=UPI00053FD5CE|nr:uncharacterized protein LOC104889442 [Beta vulgaris subsp. vulgaris]KMT15123.1 hypothetical protein BVRB_3g062410 [Beta vulgaris subsp. vulgaris]
MSEIEAEVERLENKEADYEKLKIDLDAKAKARAEAEAEAEGGDAELRSGEVELQTYVINTTKGFLRMIESHFWVGRTVTNIPNLASWTYAIPRQTGNLLEAVRWGVVYADGTDSTARKWVVAFDSAAQKAYAEAGPFGPVDWNVVEVKLGLSESKVEYVDSALGGKTVAEINGLVARGTFSN